MVMTDKQSNSLGYRLHPLPQFRTFDRVTNLGFLWAGAAWTRLDGHCRWLSNRHGLRIVLW